MVSRDGDNLLSSPSPFIPQPKNLINRKKINSQSDLDDLQELERFKDAVTSSSSDVVIDSSMAESTDEINWGRTKTDRLVAYPKQLQPIASGNCTCPFLSSYTTSITTQGFDSINQNNPVTYFTTAVQIVKTAAACCTACVSLMTNQCGQTGTAAFTALSGSYLSTAYTDPYFSNPNNIQTILVTSYLTNRVLSTTLSENVISFSFPATDCATQTTYCSVTSTDYLTEVTFTLKIGSSIVFSTGFLTASTSFIASTTCYSLTSTCDVYRRRLNSNGHLFYFSHLGCDLQSSNSRDSYTFHFLLHQQFLRHLSDGKCSHFLLPIADHCLSVHKWRLSIDRLFESNFIHLIFVDQCQ